MDWDLAYDLAEVHLVAGVSMSDPGLGTPIPGSARQAGGLGPRDDPIRPAGGRRLGRVQRFEGSSASL